MVDPKTLIFDFDGTIADSLDFILKIVDKLAKKYDYKQVDSKNNIKCFQEPAMQELFSRMDVPFYKIPFIIREIQNEMASGMGKLRPFDGISQAIKELKNLKFKLAIISSNSEDNVKKFLIKNNLDIFDFIESVDVYNLFSKNFQMISFLYKYSLNNESCIYIGDEIRDIESARKSNLKIISVGWGFNCPDALRQNNPDFLISDPIELVKILKEYKWQSKKP